MRIYGINPEMATDRELLSVVKRRHHLYGGRRKRLVTASNRGYVPVGGVADPTLTTHAISPQPNLL